MSDRAARPKILLIEDNPSTRKLMRVSLEPAGYAVAEAADGVSALEYLALQRPDLIIQDLVLPDIGGIELTHRIRRLPHGAAVPIIVVSGFVGRLDEVRAMKDQYVEVLVKPVLPSHLVERVRAHLVVAPAVPHPADQGLHVLLVDDSPTQLLIGRQRFERRHFRVTTAPSGEAALEMLGALTPDVVVSDIVMAGIDGFELCQTIRSHPEYHRIPVVLVSADQDERDVDRARTVGASSFVVRQMTGDRVIDAAHDAIASAAPALPSGDLPVERGGSGPRTIERLERHLTTKGELEVRCAVQAAELALLGGIAGALSRSADTDQTLRDIFTATLDAAGISSGVLFLVGADGELTLRQSLGFGASEDTAEFFGARTLLTRIIEQQIPVSVPSASMSAEASARLLAGASCASMQIVPVVFEGEGVGALVLGSRASDLPSEGLVAFARAIGGQIVQSLALIRAFDARKAAEEALRRSNEDLERRVEERTAELVRTSRLRADMLAFVSHDLRSPLSTISVGAAVLQQQLEHEPSSDRVLVRIARAAAQMQTLIAGLLDFASIEAGTFSVQRSKVQLSTLLDEVVDVHGPTALAKGVDLQVVANCDGWLSVDGDRVRQVLANLIGNALKFTPAAGQVYVIANEVEGCCQVEVVDTGCGISPEHLAHVFDRYWHIPGGRERGTGLGLAIAKGIVEAHGEALVVESTLGEGSRFRFTLGLLLDTEAPAAAFIRAAPSSWRVLVVEDDEEARTQIAAYLAGKGFTVLQAADGAAALALLRANEPHLILLDRVMPVMSGDQFLEARADDAAAARIPVVMMTAHTYPPLPDRIEVVQKPFGLAELLDVVNRHCHAA